MKIEVQGLKEDENLVIGLKKQVIEESWSKVIGDEGEFENRLSLSRNVIEESIDTDHIYFKGKVPKDGNIELPEFLAGMTLMLHSQGFGKSYGSSLTTMEFTCTKDAIVFIPYHNSRDYNQTD